MTSGAQRIRKDLGNEITERKSSYKVTYDFMGSLFSSTGEDLILINIPKNLRPDLMVRTLSTPQTEPEGQDSNSTEKVLGEL